MRVCVLQRAEAYKALGRYCKGVGCLSGKAMSGPQCRGPDAPGHRDLRPPSGPFPRPPSSWVRPSMWDWLGHIPACVGGLVSHHGGLGTVQHMHLPSDWRLLAHHL